MSIDTLREEALDHQSETVAFRRRLHERPEIGNDLPITRELLLETIDDLPLDLTRHESTSGVTALLTGSRPGPTILLRGDMDALPLHEDTDLAFTSKHDGAMHACGHDTHTAMLATAARVLAGRRDEIAGRVLFMFQPGEEGYHGARFMLDEGLLDVPPLADGQASPVTAAFAMHIFSTMRSGMVATRGGAIMASADQFVLRVTGRGGHASEPFRALDPIPIACEIVQALQTMVTRRVSVFDPAVLTVGRITAGTTNNIIPETAEIEGTIRAISERTRAEVQDHLRRVADGIAGAHGAEVDIDLDIGYPVTDNHADFADFSLGVAEKIVGPDNVHRMPHPIMGAEDFSYVVNTVPGAMMFLGGTHPDRDPATAPSNHSNRVVFDEAAMVDGVAVYCAMALEHLG